MTRRTEPPGRPLEEESDVELRGRIFDVVRARLRFPSGLRQELLLVEHPGAVAVAPVLESGELLLVRQYRHAARDLMVELPAGRLEPGETPLEAARRELAEETGHGARRWRELTSFLPAPGFCSERITLFEARELVPAEGRPDDDEELELVRMAPAEILERSNDGKTLLAAAWLLLGR